MSESEERWGCRFEADEETGEVRVLLAVDRLSQDAMREVVRGLLDGSLFPSVAVPDNLKGMVFLPVAMGALRPPKEAILEVMGSEEAPETVEGDPEKPKHPGYPNRNPDPPEKPTLLKPDPEIEFARSWEDLEEGEWEEHLAEIEAENKRRIQTWQAAHEAWDRSLDEISAKCREIDEDYQAKLEAWEAELALHQDRVAERERARDEWITKYDRIFSRWGEDVGCLIGDMAKTFPRSINGYPMFHAFSVVHREDWVRIDNAARREAERLNNIEV